MSQGSLQLQGVALPGHGDIRQVDLEQRAAGRCPRRGDGPVQRRPYVDRPGRADSRRRRRGDGVLELAGRDLQALRAPAGERGVALELDVVRPLGALDEDGKDVPDSGDGLDQPVRLLLLLPHASRGDAQVELVGGQLRQVVQQGQLALTPTARNPVEHAQRAQHVPLLAAQGDARVGGDAVGARSAAAPHELRA